MTVTPGGEPAREPQLDRAKFELPVEGGLAIRGEALLPPDARGCVILCHGFKGFARWAFFPHLADRLASAGLRVVTFDFSGSGIGADGESFTDFDAFEQNTYTKELRDLSLVADECERRGWLAPRGHYGLFGHSRGGGIAILHATRDARVRTLVTWSAIAEVGRWPAEEVPGWRERGYLEVPNTRTGQIMRVGLATLDEVERLSSSELNIMDAASRVQVPWLIVHGAQDETVPCEDAERLHAANTEMSRLMLIHGTGHTFDVRHPMAQPSPALEQAAAATTEFFVANVV